MAKRPKSRTIRGVKYSIEYVDQYDLRLDDDDGLVDLYEKTILISKTPSTLFYTIEDCIEHECAHAMLHEAGIMDLDPKFEHVLVEAIVRHMKEAKR